MEVKGALDKYNIITLTFFKKENNIFIALKVFCIDDYMLIFTL